MEFYEQKRILYIVKQNGKTLFVGRLKQIRRRFRQHWSHTPLMFLPTEMEKLGFSLIPVKQMPTLKEDLRKLLNFQNLQGIVTPKDSSNPSPKTAADAQTETTGYNRSMTEEQAAPTIDPLITLKEKLKDIPHKPGVYKFLHADGSVLYVGKAKDLRSRVAQYFGTHDNRAQLPFLMAEAADIDYVVVNTELESLFLENTLIKEYMPPYNIKLRDDKNYAFIKIDYSGEIPQILYVRKVDNTPHAKFFGPFSSTKKIKQTLDFVRRVFPYCANKEVGNRPCFYYFLHRCPGICIGQITDEEYKKQLDKIALFLSGKTGEIRKQLDSEMRAAANDHKFEAAARLRDQVEAIKVLDEKQITIFAHNVAWDFVSVHTDALVACVNVFKVRSGKLTDKENFIYDNILNIPLEIRLQTILESFTENYYSQATDLPKEVYIQEPLSNFDLLKDLIRARGGKAANISSPSKGEKLRLVELGKTNAEQYLRKWQSSQASDIDIQKETLDELKTLLNLPTLPRRIEGYDISNTQGTNPVGSMVVTKDGRAAKSEYRKFKITVKNTPDDFSMMREMLSRRLSRVAPEKPEDAWPIPDLLVIDGGKGQLGVAVEVLAEKNLNIPVIGLAKRIEEIFLPHNQVPLILSHDNPVLQLLQRLRDEAHRFGITFHRSLRSKQAVTSALDTIPGIGPKTKKLLKSKIGTVDKIRQTSLEDLEKLVGNAKAVQIKKVLS